MANVVTNKRTSLSAEETIVRAVQFLSTDRWRPTSQSQRTVTFEGKVPIPWFMILFMILGFLCCILPGIILYVMVIRKMYRFINMVVTANPIEKGTEVSASYPKMASKLVSRFLDALPPLVV